jgi:hypothetical protein
MKYNLLAMTLIGLMSLPASAENNRVDYDLDDDRLIEINDLGDLYEIRNNLSGPALYGQTTGCPYPCKGYELTKDLDFDTNQNGIFDQGDVYWNGGEGWLPSSLANTIFDGNGFVIRHLTINRPASSHQGLFESAFGTIRRLGLVDVSVTALSVSGALAGISNALTVEGVFATGNVSGGQDGYPMGGLFGHTTGIVVKNSFSSVTVSTRYFSGYVIANVGSQVELYNILVVGKLNERQPLEGPKSFNSYNYGYFHDSYLATDVAGIPNDHSDLQDKSFGALLSELKCPVAANDTSCIPGKTLYRNWPAQDDGSGIYWDFGNNQELPGLVLNGKLHRIDVTIDTSNSSSSVSNSHSSSSVSSSRSSSSISTSRSSSSSSMSSVAHSASSTAGGGIIFYENFENGTVDTQPVGWQNFISWVANNSNTVSGSQFALIDNSKSYNGSKSVHFKGGSNPAQILRAVPSGTQRLYTRAYVNMSVAMGNVANDNHEHIFGTRRTLDDIGQEIRAGQIKGVLGVNQVPSDNLSPKMDKWYSGFQMAANTWYCVETAYLADESYDTFHMWVDGNLVHTIDSADDWNNGALEADWMYDRLNYVLFGFHSFSNRNADVWMDELVVSTQPIGCGAVNPGSSSSSVSSSSRSSKSSSKSSSKKSSSSSSKNKSSSSSSSSKKKKPHH